MRTFSVRDVYLNDPDTSWAGTVRGYATVLAGAGVSVDTFQVDTGNDFAVGGAAFPESELCRTVRIRFLRGGAFSGGTRLQFYTEEAYGGTLDDPPSLTGVTYDESGTQISNFNLYTPFVAGERPIDSLIPASATFGSIDLTFENPQGGYAWVTHDALGRFSVRVEGICLDSP